MARRYKARKSTGVCTQCLRRWTITRDGLLRRHASFAGCVGRELVAGSERPGER